MTHTLGGADGARAGGRNSSVGAQRTPPGGSPAQAGAGRSSPAARAPDPLLSGPQYRGCFRKKPFTSRKLAREAAARVTAETGKKIRVYRCAYKKLVGEHWHLTSKEDR